MNFYGDFTEYCAHVRTAFTGSIFRPGNEASTDSCDDDLLYIHTCLHALIHNIREHIFCLIPCVKRQKIHRFHYSIALYHVTLIKRG